MCAACLSVLLQRSAGLFQGRLRPLRVLHPPAGQEQDHQEEDRHQEERPQP